MNILQKVERGIIAFILIPFIIANSGVDMAELKEEAKRRGKLKEIEEIERRIWLDVAFGLIFLIILLVIFK